LREAAIRALVDWKTPEALEDAAALAQKAPSDRLRILALRGFVRQLELSFTVPLEKQIARLEQAQAWAVRDEDKTFVAAARTNTQRLLDEQGFKPMFNGVDMKQWRGGGGFWQVKDGILQAQSSEEKLCKKNSQLIWTGGQPGDFEMRAEFRLSPNANSGIQLRCKDQEFGDNGYQADMNGAATMSVTSIIPNSIWWASAAQRSFSTPTGKRRSNISPTARRFRRRCSSSTTGTSTTSYAEDRPSRFLSTA
jgi:hypothetical protein